MSVLVDSVADPVNCLFVSVFVDSMTDPVAVSCLHVCFSVC